MIKSLGGGIVLKDGSIAYPGSGGTVGGLSEPGRNYAYIMGAGAEYYRTDPRLNSSIITPDLPPDDNPPGPGPNGPGGPPIQPNGGAGGGSIGNGGGTPIVTATGSDCRFNNCGDRGRVSGGISDLVQTLLSSNPNKRELGGPVYLFSPQPGAAGGSAGISPVMVLAVAGLGVVGWFAYKRFKG